MYSEVFCQVYNTFGWNYYPEAFGEALLQWQKAESWAPKTALDLGCGTGVLCRILDQAGIETWGMDFSSGMIAIAREDSPHIHYEVADMVTYRPDRTFDLVTCTGDALNHIGNMADVAQIFQNVWDYLNPGGYFVFDILDENEVSDSEPFEMDFSDRIRVWFQMTRPDVKKVNLMIRVFEQDVLQFEENIRETLHDPKEICSLLEKTGFTVTRCAHSLMGQTEGTTWFVIAKK